MQSYDEFAASLLRKIAEASGIPYDQLTKGYPPMKKLYIAAPFFTPEHLALVQDVEHAIRSTDGLSDSATETTARE